MLGEKAQKGQQAQEWEEQSQEGREDKGGNCKGRSKGSTQEIDQGR